MKKEYYEQNRGIIGDIVHRQLSISKLPSFYIGKQIVAARQAPPDFDPLQHLCIEYYKYFLQLYSDGIILQTDLDYKKKIVISWLPKRAIQSLYKYDNATISSMWNRLLKMGLIGKHNIIKMRIIFLISKYFKTFVKLFLAAIKFTKDKY